MDAVCRGAHPPANRPAISVPPEQGEAAAVPAARTIFRVPGHGPFMMHTTTTATTAVPAARTGSIRARPRDLCIRKTTTADLAAYTGRSGTNGTNAVPRLVRAWTLLSAWDNSCVDRMQAAHDHIRMVEATESDANLADVHRKAVLVRFVRGDERILAELGGLVPSDAEAERDSYGAVRTVSMAVEG